MKRTKHKRQLSSLKDKVSSSLKRRKGTPAWLDKAIPFDGSVRLPNVDFTKISDEVNFTGYLIEQKKLNLEILLANLFHPRKLPILISKRWEDWKEKRYNRASYQIIELIDELEKLGYVKTAIGYQTKSESRYTRTWATDKLLDACPQYSQHVISEPVELVEKRSWDGKLLPYDDTRLTWRIRDILTRINKVNAASSIRYKQWALNAAMVAVYKERFTWYGRLHTRGYRHIQKLAEKDRAEVTINGDKIVELDYQAMLPNLLYNSIGIQYVGDPYQKISDEMELRPFFKNLFLCMVNSKDEQVAEKAINKYIRDHWKEVSFFGVKNAKPFMDEFIKTNEPISHLLCKGKITGMKLMNKDAAIALDVLNHFAKQDIVALAIHDSFIVQQQYEDELRSVMKSVYKKHSGGYRINVKKSPLFV